MSSRRSVAFVASVVIVLTVLPPGMRPALAFTEGPSNNFFGTGAGDDPANTGINNSFFGGSAGTANTTGSNNAFFGLNSGLRNTTGSENSFFGTGAGGFNTEGQSNAFFGREAGLRNTNGSDNAFFGRDAGRVNTTGFANSFFGREAGISNTTGCCNSFYGRDAGLSNTTAHANAFFGHSAGRSNKIGSDNVFIGLNAGVQNTEGSGNSFVGRGAGTQNTSGSRNAFVGRQAGLTNTTGDENTFLGDFAGLSNTTESGNTFLGASTDGFTGITNATAVGNQAQVSQSNSLVLGSVNGVNDATANVNVGIGTTTPDEPLHVRRGNGTAKVLVEEASATTLGRELFQLVNNGAARFRVSNTDNGATWDFQSSGGGGSFVIDRVGGPASLDFEIQPDGDAVHLGTVTAAGFITSSDRNLKTDITPAKASKLMALLRQLDISTWRFKDEPKGTVNLGPMAQDFHRLFGMGTKTTVDIRDLAALALVAAQVQQKEIDELKNAVAKLSSRK